MLPQVSIVIVTFNSLPYIEACLESVRRQTYGAVELVVIDNASSDATASFLKRFDSGRVVPNNRNVGFAAAQNQGIALTQSEWVLTLNPDVVLAPDFISRLIEAAEAHPEAGAFCGKLLRWRPAAPQPFSNIIDSAGIYFRPDLRHLDRGAEEPNRGQYEQTEYVFGATGAAAMYRRSMIHDISIAGEFFDEDFFSYREDADVAWRAQLLGWKCLFVPDARAWHVRRVTPERRSELPREINWHSVKNRFLMRIKNAGPRLMLRFLPQILVRDLLILGYAAVRDWHLFSAMLYPLKHRRSLARKRRAVQSGRRVSDQKLTRWFDFQPYTEPASSEAQPQPMRKAS